MKKYNLNSLGKSKELLDYLYIMKHIKKKAFVTWNRLDTHERSFDSDRQQMYHKELRLIVQGIERHMLV